MDDTPRNEARLQSVGRLTGAGYDLLTQRYPMTSQPALQLFTNEKHVVGCHLHIGIGHQLTRGEIYSGKLHILRTHIPGMAPEARGRLEVEYLVERLGPTLSHALLAQDLMRVETALHYLVRPPLGAAQFDALVLFVFDVGIRAFASSNVRRAVNAGMFSSIPDLLGRWCTWLGTPIDTLRARRAVEAERWLAEETE